jgi:hypothetical protein
MGKARIINAGMMRSLSDRGDGLSVISKRRWSNALACALYRLKFLFLSLWLTEYLPLRPPISVPLVTLAIPRPAM